VIASLVTLSLGLGLALVAAGCGGSDSSADPPPTGPSPAPVDPLFMGLGATYSRPWQRVTWSLSAALVGLPAFGPTSFMHRVSAADNPQAPCRTIISTPRTITPGVLTVGARSRGWSIETSHFKGREPDENRTDLDIGRLDSYAARVGCVRRGWSAQVSAAALNEPELITPYDAKKVSASLSFEQPDRRRVAWTVAFGQNREIHGNLEAYLFEGRMHLTSQDAVYARAESVAKDILDAGIHPPGIFHRHRQSQVGALTLGYVRGLSRHAAAASASAVT
jgi:hypothetical protein